MAAWLTTAGLSLQFISLWLVTPQVIGEERIRDYLTDLNHVIDRIRTGLRPRSLGSIILSVVLAVFFIAGFSALVPYGGAIASGLVGVVAGGIGGETSAGWIPKILEWLGDAVGWLAGARSNQNVISDENGSSYENGSSDENVRRFLFVGAFLFTVGFGLLLAAVWIPPQPSKS